MNKKITYIGALGKIGQKALIMIVSNNFYKYNNKLEIVLITSDSNNSKNRLNGFVKDLNGLVFCNNNQNNIKFTISNDYSEIKNSDIIICSAAKWTLKENLYNFKDNTGRLIQTFYNKDLILDIADQINKYSEKSLFAIITNQVDLICSIVRNKYPNLNVIGIGNYIDSIRLKQILYKRFSINLISGFIIGYHDSDMFLLTNSICKKRHRKLILNNYDNIINEIRNFGKIISNEQRKTNNEDSGASILPAFAIVNLVKAYCFNKKLIAPFNVLIKDKKIIKKYYNDTCNNLELSVPVEITLNKINILSNYNLLEFEKILLSRAINNFNESLDEILNPN